MRITTIVSLLVLMCALSACSDSDDGASPVSAPDTPLGLSVTATEFASLTLSWDASDDATEYKLYRAGSESGTYAEVYSGTSTECVDDGLVYATTYYYKVSAENAGGESELSAAVSGMTDIPDGFTVTGSPSGGVDYTFTYVDEYNGHPRYQSTPIGLYIVVPSAGGQAGLWCFYDQIEGINRYYHPTASDYPPPAGWRAVYNDAETSILLTPFAL